MARHEYDMGENCRVSPLEGLIESRPIQNGHSEITDNHVVRVVLEQVQRVDTVARRVDLVAGPGEGIRCDGPDMRIVIHD